jgi:hypothetical protein
MEGVMKSSIQCCKWFVSRMSRYVKRDWSSVGGEWRLVGSGRGDQEQRRSPIVCITNQSNCKGIVNIVLGVGGDGSGRCNQEQRGYLRARPHDWTNTCMNGNSRRFIGLDICTCRPEPSSNL